MKAVYTELHRSHDPQFFLVRGVVKRTTEQPERADRLLAGLKAGKHDLILPKIYGAVMVALLGWRLIVWLRERRLKTR